AHSAGSASPMNKATRKSVKDLAANCLDLIIIPMTLGAEHHTVIRLEWMKSPGNRRSLASVTGQTVPPARNPAKMSNIDTSNVSREWLAKRSKGDSAQSF